MSTHANDKSAAVEKIASIHQVEGFDPASLAVEYNDLNTGEKRIRLPVMSQMAWFRLTYPEGKISVSAILAKEHYVGHAKVYKNYMDPPDCFLAEATASRKFDPEKPTVSPREWAQTAAIGIALRNAGFGLQFHAAGDAFDHVAVDELGELIAPPKSTPQAPAPTAPEVYSQSADNTIEPQTENKPDQTHAETPPEAPSPKDPFEAALQLPCPIQKYSGKTLGDLLMAGETNALIWIAEKFSKDPVIAAGARLICERSLDQSA